jgi:hypothetical protein
MTPDEADDVRRAINRHVSAVQKTAGMRLRITHTLVIPDEYRKALAHSWGLEGMATRQDVITALTHLLDEEIRDRISTYRGELEEESMRDPKAQA